MVLTQRRYIWALPSQRGPPRGGDLSPKSGRGKYLTVGDSTIQHAQRPGGVKEPGEL